MKTITINLTDKEYEVLEHFSKGDQLSKEKTMIMALRIYQLFRLDKILVRPDKNKFTILNTNDFVRAVAESTGPKYHDWSDKPHRLVYDLVAEIKRLKSYIFGEAIVKIEPIDAANFIRPEIEFLNVDT